MIDHVLLGLLEQLLSITEQFKDKMSPEDRETWQDISAAVADFRITEEEE